MRYLYEKIGDMGGIDEDDFGMIDEKSEEKMR